MVSIRHPLVILQAIILLVHAIPSSHSANVVNQTTCNGQRYIYEELAGYGFVPSNARDKYGDTLGGFGSSIAVDGKSWKKRKDGRYTGILWAIPDRGWNTQGTLNYQNRVHKFAVTLSPASNSSATAPSSPNFRLKYLDSILFTDPSGQPTTGLEADAQGGLRYNGFPLLPAADYTGDGFGGPGPGGKRVSVDSEGLVLAADGSFWISDEYGPYIYHISSTGRILSAIQPPPAYLPRRNGSVSFSSDTPPIYDPDRAVIPADTESGRANNQGLEGLTVSPDGRKLFALTQSALDQEGGPDNPARRQARLLEYDIAKYPPVYTAEYIVTLPLYTDPTKTKTPHKVAAQSEIHALGNNGPFLVLARDSGFGRGQDEDKSASNYRRVDVFDITAATNIRSMTDDGAAGAIASPATGELEQGITPATYCSPFVDFNVNAALARFGLHNGGAQDGGLLNEKWESLAVVPAAGRDEYFIISLSDNDFITQDGYMNGGKFQYKDESGFDLDTQALVFRVKLPRKARPAS
ncbi:MAG: hypothetical protein LQ342_004769 [Letrouitia transgressa]|nr:MAG: hypothetical protein LQ342_004769 [Letrouitia transgressa]